MEFIIYNKKTDRLYVMYFDQYTWSGSMYYEGWKWSFDKKQYINLIACNLDLEFIGEL